MRNLILYLLLLFQFISVFAQNERKLDSIRIALENYAQRDSLRVKMLNDVSTYYATRDITKNQNILEEAIAISEEIGYTEGFNTASSNLASLYIQQGNYDKGLELALKTKTSQTKIGDIEGIVYSNSNIARVYNELGEPQKAIEIIEESIVLLEDDPYNGTKANAHFYLANTYLGIKEFDLASKNFIAAKEIAIYNNFEIGIQIANSSLGIIELEKKDYQKAIKYLEEPKKFYKKNNQQIFVAHTNLSLAEAYLGLEDYEKAEYLSLEAAEIYDSQKKLKDLVKTFEMLNVTYETKEDYKKANYYLKERYRVQDSILSQKQLKNIEELQTKFETEKVKKEKEIAELQSTKNKNLFIGSAIIGGLILLSSLLFFGRAKATKKAQLVAVELKETQKRLAIEKQYRDSELKALKAQMNPHFIFNALNSIQEYIVLNEKNLASDYLGKFADLMRKYLYHSDKGSISVEEEVACLNTYLELEKVRFEDTLDYSITVANAIPVENTYIPTMIIQPYVENAIKHGLLHKKRDKGLSIVLVQEGKHIKCTIEDNGVGRAKSKALQQNSKRDHKSFATKATQDRLALLSFDKDQEIGVATIDLYDDNGLPKGTRIIITIPQIKA